MALVFGIDVLQLMIGVHPVINDEMENLALKNTVMDNATYMYIIGFAFQKPSDDDEAITDKAMDEKDDDVVVVVILWRHWCGGLSWWWRRGLES